MSKMNLQQLSALSLKEVQGYKEEALKRQKQLEDLKAKGGKDWTTGLQDELNEVTLFLVDVEEVIEEKASEQQEASVQYAPAKGTERLVHARISKGRRFDPNTGKEITKPYIQMFTYGEWKLFQQNCKSIGFVVLEVLHNPYDKEQ